MSAFALTLPCKRLVPDQQHAMRQQTAQAVCPIRACGPSSSTHRDAPKSPRVSIDYCAGCRWGLRAGWMAQELLVTFEKDLAEVSLRPSEEAGTFDVWLDGQLLWCRREDGGFPELKDIKQRVRDIIRPDKTLGHSDRQVTT